MRTAIYSMGHTDSDLSQAYIRAQLHAAASVETCKELETRAFLPEDTEVVVEVHPPQQLRLNVSAQLS